MKHLGTIHIHYAGHRGPCPMHGIFGNGTFRNYSAVFPATRDRLSISDHFSLLVELAMPLPLGNLNALGSATNHSGQQSVGPPKSIQQQHFNFNPSQHSMNNFMTYPPPMNNGTSMHHQQPRL